MRAVSAAAGLGGLLGAGAGALSGAVLAHSVRSLPSRNTEVKYALATAVLGSVIGGMLGAGKYEYDQQNAPSGVGAPPRLHSRFP